MTDTISSLEPGSSDRPSRESATPGLTNGEAKHAGLSPKEHRTARADAALERRHRTKPGTADGPNALPIHIEQVIANAVDAARALIQGRSEKEIDPKLAKTAQLLTMATTAIDFANTLPGQHTTSESRTNHTGQNAVRHVERSDEYIAEDNDHSITVHRRHRTLAIWGRIAPWIDLVGLVAFAAVVLDVDLLDPFKDFLGWLLGVAIPVAVVLSSAFVAVIAGRAHNAGREARAKGHAHRAEEEFGARNRWLVVLAVFALVLAAALVARTRTALAGLDDASAQLAVVVLTALAIAAGIGLLGIAYLGVALDGSRISRERDDLAGKLTKENGAQQAALQTATRALDQVEVLGEQIRLRDALAIAEDAQTLLLQGRRRHELMRLETGDVTAAPSPMPHRVLQEVDGEWRAELSTGIPGASTVSLQPLIDRLVRLQALQSRAAVLRAQLDTVHAHPWTLVGTKR